MSRGAVILVAAVILLGFLGWLAVPTITCGPVRARDAMCASQMHALSLGLQMYARDHQGDFPPSLQVLLTERYVDPRLTTILNCPVSDQPYVYIPGQRLADLASGRSPCASAPAIVTAKDSKTLLLCELRGQHSESGERGMVAFADGHVEMVSREEQEALVAATLKALASTPE